MHKDVWVSRCYRHQEVVNPHEQGHAKFRFHTDWKPALWPAGNRWRDETLLFTELTERRRVVVFCSFRCSHVGEDSDLLRTVCTVFSGTACTHQPPGAVPWQERLVRSQEHHTDSRAHGMSASLYSKQVRMKALSVSLSDYLCTAENK